MIERKIVSDRGAVFYRTEHYPGWHANPYFVVERLNNDQLVEAIKNEIKAASLELKPNSENLDELAMAYKSSRTLIRKTLERECHLREITIPDFDETLNSELQTEDDQIAQND